MGFEIQIRDLKSNVELPIDGLPICLKPDRFIEFGSSAKQRPFSRPHISMVSNNADGGVKNKE